MRKIVLVCAVMALGVLLAGGVAIANEIQGTSKNDRLKGTERGDFIYGYGGDNVVGGEGIDYLSGGGNIDTINSLDGRPDIVSCGLGDDDQVIADEEDNVATECDRVTRR